MRPLFAVPFSLFYSVRTKRHLKQRIALDMQREQRAQTTKTLHHSRSKAKSLH
jgi:hypothetical protein